jgi:hypothetical protein
MPLYKISTTGQEKPRLVEATSEAAALKHAAVGMFSASRVTSPVDAAALMSSGIALEKAGVQPEPEVKPEVKTANERVNVATGMVEALGDAVDGGERPWSNARPATLAELGAAGPGEWRVDPKAAKVQFRADGATKAADWVDVREATGEEIEAATAAK